MSDLAFDESADIDKMLEVGLEHLRSRDFAAAAAAFNEVLEREPSNVIAVKYLRFAQLGVKGSSPALKSPETTTSKEGRSTQQPQHFKRMRPARRKQRSGEHRSPLSLRSKREE